MIMFGLSLIIALFFAMNIGASGTAASMGAAYGGGAIKRRWTALVLVAAAVFCGAYFGGGEVVKTISGGIVPSSILTTTLSVTILASACIALFIANLLAIPLSTSEVTIGALVGVGAAFHALLMTKVLVILAIWIILPFAAFAIAYVFSKIIAPIERKLLKSSASKRISFALSGLLIAAGCYEAFSAGMNNVANAVGPLVGAKLINPSAAIFWGGLFIALGALLLGGRVLDTNAKKITQLSLLKSSAVSFTAGTLVVIASLLGIPVPLTQMTTMAIFGVGTADRGKSLWKSDIVKKVIRVWILSPLLSFAVSYSLVEILIRGNIFFLIGLIVACIAVFIWIGFRKYRTRLYDRPLHDPALPAKQRDLRT